MITARTQLRCERIRLNLGGYNNAVRNYQSINGKRKGTFDAALLFVGAGGMRLVVIAGAAFIVNAKFFQ